VGAGRVLLPCLGEGGGKGEWEGERDVERREVTGVRFVSREKGTLMVNLAPRQIPLTPRQPCFFAAHFLLC